LDIQLGEACRLYNAALQERRDAYKTCRKSLNYYDQANQLREIRAAKDSGLTNYSCSQDVLRRVDKAFKAFFRRIKSGNNPGYPRFKPRRRFDSITFPSYGDGIRLNGGMLRVQGIGNIKVKLHRPLVGEVKTATLKRECGKWYVCLSIEYTAYALPPLDNEIGIDVGLIDFATLSNGKSVPNPRFYKNAEPTLRRAQRKVARRKKGSNRRRKAVALLQKIHARIKNQRNEFQHKFSFWLVNNFGTIAIENLNVRGLAAGMLAKSVHDVAWAAFFSKLAYKAANAGRRLIAVNPNGTSQTCLCGAKVWKKLSDREHVCTACGLVEARDVVSAQVILQRARISPSFANVSEIVLSVE
jgi:putative transposase